ncbi:MAG: hypothetical protein RQ801_07225, partial [Spirochaetaceae bacterium]|nr:hypothetical protein [Spirochaetaceae bacterium]
MTTETRLFQYLEGLHQGKVTRDWYNKFESDLEEATPFAVNSAIDRLMRYEDDYDQLELSVARFIRAASKGLDRFAAVSVPDGHFLDVLIRENRELENLRIELTQQFKTFSTENAPPSADFSSSLQKLQGISSHYRKLQYGLFPALEEFQSHSHCVKLMWKIQDDVTAMLRGLVSDTDGFKDRKALNRVFGSMYLKTGTLIYREEKILFPVTLDAIPADRFEGMQSDLEEYGTAFGVSISRKGGTVMSENIRNREERKELLQGILKDLHEDGDIPATKKRFA